MRRIGPSLIVWFAVLAAVCVIGVSTGAERLSLQAMFEDGVEQTILLQIRLPRVLTAAFVGAILAIAGSTLQTMLRNPLADPFILGVSGGAAAAAATVSLLGFASSAPLLAVAAFCGAVAATLLVTLLASRHGHLDTVRLVVSGLVLNSFFSAVILLVLSFARGSDLVVALRWMIGSVAGAGWAEVGVTATALAVSLAVLFWFSGEMRLLVFGEDDARARGVNVSRVKYAGFFAASIATGAAVAMTGIIGFVGVLVPHFVRLIWRTDYRFELPVAALAGATLLVASDAVSRVVVAPSELPVGAFLALIGVPFFIVLLRRDR